MMMAIVRAAIYVLCATRVEGEGHMKTAVPASGRLATLQRYRP